MRIGERCGCDTCVQHRTFITQETEPTNVIVSSLTSSVPVSPGPVQALGSTSDQSSGTETTPPLAPPLVTTPVNPEPAQSVDALADASSTSSPARTSSPRTIFSFPPPVVSFPPARDLGPTVSFPGCPPFPASGPSISSSSSQASVTNLVGHAPSRPSRWGPPLQAPPPFSSTASTSSSLSSFVPPSQLVYRWGPQVQAPPPPFSSTASTSSTLSPLVTPSDLLRWRPPVQAPVQTTTPKHPFPGFSVDYLPRCPSNLSGPHPQTSTPVPPPGWSPFWAEQGSRYPPYAPTPDVDGMRLMSISASNSHGHKSHEELRWEDYKNGDKGVVKSFPFPAHKSRKESRWDQDYKNGDKDGFAWCPPPDYTPPVFAPRSRPVRPQMRTIDLTHRDMNGFPVGDDIPAAFKNPHEPLGVSSTASGCCTACGATSSSSPSSHLGLNGTTTNPPSSATSLPGLFATPNLAAHGTTATPAVQAYAIMLGAPNFTSQGTTAVQAYPVMFGIPHLAAQGTTATPAAQPYPMMYGTPNLAAKGTTTTPAAQHHPSMFGTPNLAAQGTTTTPAAQPYPTMFGTQSLAAQAYPVSGLILLPFSTMSLQ